MAYENVEGHLLAPDLARRVRWVLARMRGHSGVEIEITEGQRPVGVPGDQWVTSAAATESGGSTQWFQWGRMRRGETPEAAYPGTSSHGTGEAVDWSTNNMSLRLYYMYLAGLTQNIATETWHAVVAGPPLVNLDINQEEEELMAAKDEIINALTKHTQDVANLNDARLLAAIRGEIYASRAHTQAVENNSDKAMLAAIQAAGGAFASKDPALINTVLRDQLSPEGRAKLAELLTK